MKKVHFVGIGGIGMSALAQMLAHEGTRVTGSDKEQSQVTELLEKKGIKVIFGQKAENVSADTELLVYSDAVPSDNPERARARELNIPELSYFAMLGKASVGKRTVAVAGTHGKTTTTGMLAKILVDAGVSPTAIIGSIVNDFESNYVAGASDLFVVEACEYRDHLLELSPIVLVITNLEWDHTDYFPSLAALQETFKKAIERVPEAGAIITNLNDDNIAPLLAHAKAPIVDYAQEPAYELALPGDFNQENARAAAAAARAVTEISDTTIYDSLRTFGGSWRRFEYKGHAPQGSAVYDDYAHHPTAIERTLHVLKERATGKVFVAFHPHLYSRTRDLMDGFARAFKDADEVVIAPIYAARETFDGETTSAILAQKINAAGTHATALDSFEEIAKYLATHAGSDDVIMTMGAGDIYKVAEMLVKK